MLGASPIGLTAHDFHPHAFINPRDVFPRNSRQSSRTGHRATLGNKARPSSAATPAEVPQLPCCGDQEKQACVQLKEDDPGSPDTCEGDCDQCEDCFEDHQVCDEDQIQCVEDCGECEDEHEAACGQHGQVCTEECNDCDFSCFDCIDWNAFEKDKTLGLSYSVPILEQHETISSTTLEAFQEPDLLDMDLGNAWQDALVPPLEMSMHHYCLANPFPYWNPMIQNQLCPPNEPIFHSSQDQSQFKLPPSSYGCHPAAAHRSMNNQQPLPAYDLQTSLASAASASASASASNTVLPLSRPIQQPSDTPTTSPSDRICQWLMPCGTMCSASFATTSDLKKHIKTFHTTKGTTTCHWSTCTASFASEAALTGHISKKHLSSSTFTTDEDGPFKCTFPGCPKSFMYKQVRDEHIASCHNGNKMYCDVCNQWLNAEGSNFKRHMASHRPKHQHMICKFHHLGCKRRFPRLDNLRRHEGCCKFGKKAALHHHHHHRHGQAGH